MDGISTRGHFENLFCPLMDETIQFALYRHLFHPDRPESRVAAKGQLVVAILQRPAKPNEVIAASCEACAPSNTGCSSTLTFAACKPAVECLGSLKMSPGQCKE